jgi:hypothetical protein
MEWYKIVLFVVVWIVGIYLHGKIRGQHTDKYDNDNWKNKRKK